LVKNVVNEGVSKSFEKGLILAKGEYISVCDSDDYWFPNKLETSLDHLLKNTAILVFSDLIVTDSKFSIIRKSFLKVGLKRFSRVHGHTFKELLQNNHITGPTILFDSVLKKYLLPFPKNVMQDYWIAIIASCIGKISLIKRPTMYYRQHSNNAVGYKSLGFKNLLSVFSSHGFEIFVKGHKAQKEMHLNMLQSLLLNESVKISNNYSLVQKKIYGTRLVLDYLTFFHTEHSLMFYLCTYLGCCVDFIRARIYVIDFLQINFFLFIKFYRWIFICEKR